MALMQSAKNNFINSIHRRNFDKELAGSLFEEMWHENATKLADKMLDENFLYRDAEKIEGDGYIPVVAASILCSREGQSCLPSIFEALHRIDILTYDYELIAEYAAILIKNDIYSACDLFNRESEEKKKFIIEDIVSKSGARDEKAFKIHAHCLKLGREISASYLADIGDKRAIDLISSELDNFQLSEDNCFSNHPVIEYECAIKELGGTLTEQQKEKIKEARSITDRLFSPVKNTIGKIATKPSIKLFDSTDDKAIKRKKIRRRLKKLSQRSKKKLKVR